MSSKVPGWMKNLVANTGIKKQKSFYSIYLTKYTFYGFDGKKI